MKKFFLLISAAMLSMGAFAQDWKLYKEYGTEDSPWNAVNTAAWTANGTDAAAIRDQAAFSNVVDEAETGLASFKYFGTVINTPGAYTVTHDLSTTTMPDYYKFKYEVEWVFSSATANAAARHYLKFGNVVFAVGQEYLMRLALNGDPGAGDAITAGNSFFNGQYLVKLTVVYDPLSQVIEEYNGVVEAANIKGAVTLPGTTFGATNVAVAGGDWRIATYGFHRGGRPNYDQTNGLKSFKLYYMKQDNNKTSYKVAFVDEEGNAIKETAARETKPETALALQPADKDAIWNDDKSVKYIYVSDDVEGKMSPAQGSEDEVVVTVKFRKANKFACKLTAVIGDEEKQIASGENFEGENVKLPYPAYLADSKGLLYEMGVTNKEFAIYATEEGETKLNYKATTIESVYKAEGEEIEGLTSLAEGNISIRGSNAACGVIGTEADVKIVTLEPGYYKIGACIYSSGTFKYDNNFIMAEDTVKFSVSGSNGNWVYSENFEVKEAVDLKLEKAAEDLTGKNCGLDWVYVRKAAVVANIKYQLADGTEVKKATQDMTIGKVATLVEGVMADFTANEKNYKCLSNDLTADMTVAFDSEVNVIVTVEEVVETPTAVEAVKAVKANEGIYNLAGQKLNAAQKGINIVNGVKVLVK